MKPHLFPATVIAVLLTAGAATAVNFKYSGEVRRIIRFEKVKDKEKKVRFKDDEGKRLSAWALQYFGAGKKTGSVIKEDLFHVGPAYEGGISLGRLSYGKSADLILTFGYAVKDSESFLAYNLQFDPAIDGRTQSYATDEGGIRGSTLTLNSMYSQRSVVHVDFSSVQSGQEWRVGLNLQNEGESSRIELAHWDGLMGRDWRWDMAVGAHHVERGAQAVVFNPWMYPGTPPEDAPEVEKIEFSLKLAYAWTLDGMRHQNKLHPEDNSVPTAVACMDDATDDCNVFLLNIQHQFKGKKNPGKALQKAGNRAIKSLAKAKKKLEKGTKPIAAWKKMRKGRDAILKTLALYRHEVSRLE